MITKIIKVWEDEISRRYIGIMFQKSNGQYGYSFIGNVNKTESFTTFEDMENVITIIEDYIETEEAAIEDEK